MEGNVLLNCFSVFAILLFCLSIVGGAFAINPNVNVLNKNDIMDDDGNLNDILDFNTFTPASKIAYRSVYDLDLDLSSFPGEMHTLNEMVMFYNAHNISAVSVQITIDTLKSGDIVQLKNSESAFLVYLGKNSNGNIILEDLYHRYECSPESFNMLFTGNAIFLKHMFINPNLINRDIVDDNPINDPNIHTAPMATSFSVFQAKKNTWNNAEYDLRIKKIAKDLKTSSSDYQNLKNIYAWMGVHIKYHFHYNTRDSLDYTLKNGKANCCEQARIMVAIARAMGMTAKYIQVPGHVFSKEWANDKGRYVVIDTCYRSQHRFDKPSIVPSGAKITDNLGFKK
jgi:hypothetical protein